jgi:hypothetical protein
MNNAGTVFISDEYHKTIKFLFGYLSLPGTSVKDYIRKWAQPIFSILDLKDSIRQLVDFKRIAPEILFKYVHKDLIDAERVYQKYARSVWETRLDFDYQDDLQTPEDKRQLSAIELHSIKSYGKLENYYGKIFTGYEYQKVLSQLSLTLRIPLPDEQETFDAVCKQKTTQEMLEESRELKDHIRRTSTQELRQIFEPRCVALDDLCNKNFYEFFGNTNN